MPFDENGSWISDAPSPEMDGSSTTSLMDLLSPFGGGGGGTEWNVSADQPNDSQYAPDYDPARDLGSPETSPQAPTQPPPVAQPAPQRPMNQWEQLLGGLQFYPDANENTRQMALNEARHQLGNALVAAGLAPDARHRALVYAQMLDKTRQAYRSTLDFGDRQAKEAKNEAWQEEARAHQKKSWENEEWRQDILKKAFDNSHENAPAEVAENTKLLEESLQKAIKDGRMSEQEANAKRIAMGALTKKYLADPTDAGLFSSMYKLLDETTTLAGTSDTLRQKVADDLWVMAQKTGMTVDEVIKVAHQAAILPGQEWDIRRRLLQHQLDENKRADEGRAAIEAAGGALPVPGAPDAFWVNKPGGDPYLIAGKSGEDKAAIRKFYFQNAEAQRIATQPDAQFGSDTATQLATMMNYDINTDILPVPGSPGQWMLSPERQQDFGQTFRTNAKNFADTSRTTGRPTQAGAPSGGAAPVTMADIRRIAKEKGVSEEVAMQNALANGHPILP